MGKVRPQTSATKPSAPYPKSELDEALRLRREVAQATREGREGPVLEANRAEAAWLHALRVSRGLADKAGRNALVGSDREVSRYLAGSRVDGERFAVATRVPPKVHGAHRVELAAALRTEIVTESCAIVRRNLWALAGLRNRKPRKCEAHAQLGGISAEPESGPEISAPPCKVCKAIQKLDEPERKYLEARHEDFGAAYLCFLVVNLGLVEGGIPDAPIEIVKHELRRLADLDVDPEDSVFVRMALTHALGWSVDKAKEAVRAMDRPSKAETNRRRARTAT